MPAGRERKVLAAQATIQEAEAVTPRWGLVLLMIYTLTQTWGLELA